MSVAIGSDRSDVLADENMAQRPPRTWHRGRPDHDFVVELEQAGDSAKVAAEADAGLSGDARESVLAAHLAICKLKAGA